MPPKKTVPKPVAKPVAKPKAPTAKTGLKKAAAPGTKKSSKDDVQKTEKKPEKVWTEKDSAAMKIQCQIRMFLSKKHLVKLKKDKEDYEEKMEQIEREAFVMLVKMEQEQAEKERRKEEAERRRRKEEAQRRKRMLEAAFDGEIDEINIILKEVEEQDNTDVVAKDTIGLALRNKHRMDMVECEDANANTPLSEAANGGDPATVKHLLDLGADPNSRGQFLRTPLYRAAFAGHMETCQILLDHGADPRLYADDGQMPEHVASMEPVIDIITSWDISQTEYLLQKLQEAREKRSEETRKRQQAEQEKLEGDITELTKDYNSKQKQLDRAYCELNKRITEHDLALTEGFDRPELTIAAIKDAETDVEMKKMDSEKSRDKLAQAKLELRKQQKQGAELGEDLPGIKVNIRELDDVLVRDVGNPIRDSGKWPLLIDQTKQVSTFLRYRDTNYLNTLNSQGMEPDKVRLALLGALRYGKPFVLDMMEVDMFDTVSARFDEIKKGLMASIMDKSILKEEVYAPLIKDADGPDYEKVRFIDDITANFKLVILTMNPYPPESLVDMMYPIRVVLPS